MEGTTFELRPTGPNYPLTLDQRLKQGDHYRNDHITLQKTLLSIQNFYLSQYASAHTGEHLDCERCIGLNRQVKQAYREWYLSEEPDRWYSKLYDYKIELQSMFENPSLHTLKDIHARADKELRAHLKKDLCVHSSGDTDEVAQYKKDTASQLDSGELPIPEILSSYLEAQFKYCPKSDLVDFIRQLQNTTTDEERIPIYVQYYCGDLWSDSSNIKNFKAKYTRMFEQKVPHDTVVAAMRKDVAESRDQEIGDLMRRLNELNLAQSAHLKAKAKKAEKDQLKEERNLSLVKKSGMCEYEGCEKEVDLEGDKGALECILCDWIARLVPGDQKIPIYCSVDHAIADHDHHDRISHSCLNNSTNSCVNEPEPGPPETYSESGLCRDCVDKGIKAFFCTQECYMRNLEAHRNGFHSGEALKEGGHETLEIFRVPDDMLEEVEDREEGEEADDDVEMKGV